MKSEEITGLLVTARQQDRFAGVRNLLMEACPIPDADGVILWFARKFRPKDDYSVYAAFSYFRARRSPAIHG